MVRGCFPVQVRSSSQWRSTDVESAATKGKVFSGEHALRRKQVAWRRISTPGCGELVVPRGGKVFVHCFLDPDDTPETIMIQFHTDGWKHRAVWGAKQKIPFGKPRHRLKKS